MADELVRSAGCCTRCVLRFTGQRDPLLYHVPQINEESNENSANLEPILKKSKVEICICCLGLLQPSYWDAIIRVVKDETTKNSYDSEYFACGLSLPACMALREYSLRMHVKNFIPSWKLDNIVPFKQAWKWSFGSTLANIIGKKLDSGSVCDYLITLHMKYKFDSEELESLKKMAPGVFEERSKSHEKFRGELFTRTGIDNLLKVVDPWIFKNNFDCPPKSVSEGIECAKVEFQHDPIYVGGRYIKYSRELCQTPWVIEGKKIMTNSIQEIIFEPLVEFFKVSPENIEKQVKFISSGREDVDVRCLGQGRPFAIEIWNPRVSKLTENELDSMTAKMNSHLNLLKVEQLQNIPKGDLVILKQGENEKTKTYFALCIKLSKRDPSDINDEIDFENITDDDLNIINTYSNDKDNSIVLKQKTPLRVLHRRPLLERKRKILCMKASHVKDSDRSDLFTLELTTEAGTYIKEFVHGDFGRTEPNLSQILGCKVDILALDVNAINLEWPIIHKK